VDRDRSALPYLPVPNREPKECELKAMWGNAQISIALQQDGAVSNAIDARTRWVATKTLDGRRWIIADICLPGDWYGYFATWCEADAEARKRNGPHLTVVGEDYTGDDDIPF
jgi:hypothetical protein